MGGFQVPSQPFGIYQALDWLCNKNATLSNQISAARRVREWLENGKADDLVKLGIVSRLAELLNRTYQMDLQSEIIWSMANIAAGKSLHTKLVLRNCLLRFRDLLDDNCIDEIKNDIIWAYSNIAGDSTECRDELLKAGILDRVIHLLNSNDCAGVEKNCIWFLSNMFRHSKNQLRFEIAQPCLPILARYLKHSNTEIVCNVCWTLKYLASGVSKHSVGAVIDAGVCPSLVALLNYKPVVNCALLVAINLLSGTNRQTDALVACNVIPAFMKLLEQDSESNVIKNVCFALSNIAASGPKHIDALFGAKVYTKLIEIFNNSCHASIKTEIVHVFCNTLCNHHFNSRFREKLGFSYLNIFLDSLNSCDDQATVLQALRSHKSLPKQAFLQIKNLIGHRNPEIAHLARNIIDSVKFE